MIKTGRKYCGKVIMLLALAVMLTGLNVITSEAVTIATLTRDGTTFTGSNVYVGLSGPSGYYQLSVSADIQSDSLYENVTLKSSTGVSRPAVVALGHNTRGVSANTGIFEGGYYTMDGYYFYTVTSCQGKEYKFSTTR